MNEREAANLMVAARVAAAGMKRTANDYCWFLGNEAVAIERAQKSLLIADLRAEPYMPEMERAQVFRRAAMRFEFEKLHEADVARMLRQLSFAEWLKTQPDW